ncbi:hypothetical protein XAUC_31210 [Xanthomonas citri pv. aurantifolii str. ICPB 10535]|nr:hypothetical protein XAUC_31210 [Xanthomonas citri pv. aurantifolii str. ICPB 10535]
MVGETSCRRSRSVRDEDDLDQVAVGRGGCTRRGARHNFAGVGGNGLAAGTDLDRGIGGDRAASNDQGGAKHVDGDQVTDGIGVALRDTERVAAGRHQRTGAGDEPLADGRGRGDDRQGQEGHVLLGHF